MQKQLSTQKQTRQHTSAPAAQTLRSMSEQASLALQALLDRLRPYHQALKIKASIAYRELTNRLDLALRDILDYVSPEASDLDAVEQKWAMQAVTAVAKVISGDDPYDVLCRMSIEERAFAVEQLHRSIAAEMDFPACELIFSDGLAMGQQGHYDHTRRVLVINETLISGQPMSHDTARILLTTVLHESFHRFQYVAMCRPQQYAVSKNLARLWRDNARHYIAPYSNPWAHMDQPLESSARWFAQVTTNTLSDRAFLFALQLTLDDSLEGGF